MAGYRQIYVTDTNVWIDLHVGGLIDCFFRLPFLFIAPDVIIEELKEPDGKKLISLGLRKVELAGKEVQQVIELAGRYPAPSPPGPIFLPLRWPKLGMACCSPVTGICERQPNRRRCRCTEPSGSWINLSTGRSLLVAVNSEWEKFIKPFLYPSVSASAKSCTILKILP
ncbi:MAG: hypothetical protein PWQ31_1643, partial [Eubacteriales bacterium]|nr:hypothetical protein [Eubacteriales bacterium]